MNIRVARDSICLPRYMGGHHVQHAGSTPWAFLLLLVPWCVRGLKHLDDRLSADAAPELPFLL